MFEPIGSDVMSGAKVYVFLSRAERHVRCAELVGTAAYLTLYRVSQEEWTKLRESVPYVKLYRYNANHLYPKLDGYGDNGQRSVKL